MIRPEALARSDVADLDQTRDFCNSIGQVLSIGDRLANGSQAP
jgi:hypothetical protein